MCGLVGYFSSQPICGLEEATNILNHRGPDASNHVLLDDQTIGLGHTRLSIVDLSITANQPMSDKSSRYTIIFNGEIYNHLELKSKLQSIGVEFKTNSDTEVLLNHFIYHGVDGIQELNGIFSFVVYDSYHKKMTLVRDRLGIKPLYFKSSSTGIIFASEIKAIKHLIEVDGTLDPITVCQHLTFNWSARNFLPSKDFEILPAGSYMEIVNAKITKNSRWKLEKPKVGQKSKSISSVEKLEEILTRAIERQLMGDVKIGAFLSGGLDSSLLVALASKFNSDIKCYTMSVDHSEADGQQSDLAYARQVADYLNIELTEVESKSTDLINNIENFIWHLEEPLADPAALFTKFISRRAKEDGLKVLISGLGADDIFTGYRRHLIASRINGQFYPTSLAKKLYFVLEKLFGFNSNMVRKTLKALKPFTLPKDQGLITLFEWQDPNNVVKLLDKRHRSCVQSNEISLPLTRVMSKNETCLKNALKIEQDFFLPKHNLLYTDKMSMSEGIEVRVPYLDNEVVEFARSLSDDELQVGLVSKKILKKLGERYLPSNIVYRSKTGFGAPVRRWIKHDLNDYIDDTLSIERLYHRGIFDAKEVRNLIVNNKRGVIDASYTILSILLIELWFTKFIDQ